VQGITALKPAEGIAAEERPRLVRSETSDRGTRYPKETDQRRALEDEREKSHLRMTDGKKKAAVFL